jgi:hypothetical protein
LLMMITLLHDNVCPHTATFAAKWAGKSWTTLLTALSWGSPQWFLFEPMKVHLGGKKLHCWTQMWVLNIRIEVFMLLSSVICQDNGKDALM